MKNSNMVMNVDFISGTTFMDAIFEAQCKARALDVAYVRFVFSGVNISISQTADLHAVNDAYENKTDNLPMVY